MRISTVQSCGEIWSFRILLQDVGAVPDPGCQLAAGDRGPRASCAGSVDLNRRVPYLLMLLQRSVLLFFQS